MGFLEWKKLDIHTMAQSKLEKGSLNELGKDKDERVHNQRPYFE